MKKIIRPRDVAEVPRVLPGGDHRARQGHLDCRPHGGRGTRPAIRSLATSTRRRADLQEHRSDAQRSGGVIERHGHDDRLPHRFPLHDADDRDPRRNIGQDFPASAAIAVKGFADPSMLIDIQGIAVVA
jgi:hypothetical protein